MRQILRAALLSAILISFNPSALDARVETSFEVGQKKKAPKPSTQRPPERRVPGGVPGGVPADVDRPLPLSQTLPDLVRKGEEIDKDAIKRVAPVYPPHEKAIYARDRLDVEVVVDEEGNVIAAEPLSFHPLHGRAVEAARQWKFKPALRAGKPAKATDTISFRVSEGAEGEEDKVWQANLKSCRELIAKKTPDKQKLALAMANLAIAGMETERLDEALQLFREAEQQNRMPVEAKPYYAELIEYTFNQDRERPDQQNADASGTQGLQRALGLYVQAYTDESQKKPVDGRLLFAAFPTCLSDLIERTRGVPG